MAKKPKKLEKSGIERISITPVLNGYLCKVGCRTVVFTDAGEMCIYLKAYLANPKGFEVDYEGTVSVSVRYVLESGSTTSTISGSSCDSIHIDTVGEKGI